MFNLEEKIMTDSYYYKKGIRIKPTGLVLHSVGCNQPSAEIFIKNWNRPDYTAASVHAFIDANNGTVYQSMPWNFRAPHVGGAYNNSHIGVEMCEPMEIHYTGGASFTFNESDRTSIQSKVLKTYNTAVQLFAWLCVRYNIEPVKPNIVSHREAFLLGKGTNHGDPEHLWNGVGLNLTMDKFRKDVAETMKMLEDVERYNSVEEVPDWGKSTVQKLIDNGTLKGNGTEDGSNPLALSRDMLRILVILDRKGIFD